MVVPVLTLMYRNHVYPRDRIKEPDCGVQYVLDGTKRKFPCSVGFKHANNFLRLHLESKLYSLVY